MKAILAIIDEQENILEFNIEKDKKREFLDELNKVLKIQYVKNFNNKVSYYISINNSEFYNLNDMLIEEKGKYKICLKE